MTEQKRIILPNDIIIEPALFEDIPKTAALYAEVSPQIDPDYRDSPENRRKTQKRYQKVINSPNSVLYIARSGDNLVGYGIATFDEEGKHWNRGLFVSQPKEGIGRALTKARVLWHGEVDIFLKVFPQNPAVGFHRKLGFEPTGVQSHSLQGYPLEEMKLSVQRRHIALK